MMFPSSPSRNSSCPCCSRYLARIQVQLPSQLEGNPVPMVQQRCKAVAGAATFMQNRHMLLFSWGGGSCCCGLPGRKGNRPAHTQQPEQAHRPRPCTSCTARNRCGYRDKYLQGPCTVMHSVSIQRTLLPAAQILHLKSANLHGSTRWLVAHLDALPESIQMHTAAAVKAHP